MARDKGFSPLIGTREWTVETFTFPHVENHVEKWKTSYIITFTVAVPLLADISTVIKGLAVKCSYQGSNKKIGILKKLAKTMQFMVSANFLFGLSVQKSILQQVYMPLSLTPPVVRPRR